MDTFATLFGYSPDARGSAPGRVNVLGEHTDYNDGFVLPAAIPQTTTVDAALSRTDAFLLHSTSECEPGAIVSYRSGEAVPDGFARYIDGCTRALLERGVRVPPVALFIESTVPIGAGLSSSAALEVATLRALRELLGLKLDDVEIALTAQAAENKYVGVRCGIMDQMASSLADAARITHHLREIEVPPPAGITCWPISWKPKLPWNSSAGSLPCSRNTSQASSG